ncbi:hypothetical protein D3C76_1225810 [compost metagenome]
MDGTKSAKENFPEQERKVRRNDDVPEAREKEEGEEGIQQPSAAWAETEEGNSPLAAGYPFFSRFQAFPRRSGRIPTQRCIGADWGNG